MSVALENFNDMYTHLSVYARLVGICLEIRNDNYPTTALTWIWVGLLCMLFMTWMYTCCVADMTTIWFSCAMMPMMLQGLAKFYVHIKHARAIAYHFAFLRRIYSLNQNAHTANYWLLVKWSVRIRFIVRYSWIPILATSVVFVAPPIWAYIMTGQRNLILPLWLVGVSRDSWSGYAVHCVFHMATVVLAMIGTLGSDLALFMLTLHVWPMTDIWVNMVQRTDRALSDPQHRDSAQRQAYFRHLLDVHRELIEYMASLSEIFELCTFCEMFTCPFMLCVFLYCYIMVGTQVCAVTLEQHIKSVSNGGFSYIGRWLLLWAQRCSS